MEARKIVLPGELIDQRKGRRLGQGVYAEGDKVFASVIGIPRTDENEMEVIPLSGVYIPLVGDKVIGVIENVEISGWSVDINSPYTAFLHTSESGDRFLNSSRVDLSSFYDIGDIIFCKVSKVTKNKNIQVSMYGVGAKKLYSGTLIRITYTKIPRLIGKGGSMISMIKKNTGCDVIAGENGVIWIRGDDKTKAIEAILTIDKESHIAGLTEKIEKLLGGEKSTESLGGSNPSDEVISD